MNNNNNVINGVIGTLALGTTSNNNGCSSITIGNGSGSLAHPNDYSSNYLNKSSYYLDWTVYPQPNYVNDWIVNPQPNYVDYTNYTIKTITNPLIIQTNMIKKYEDDKLRIVHNLSGYKLNEVTVKYLGDTDNCKTKSQILISAKSKDHPFKIETQEFYETNFTEILEDSKEYDFKNISVKLEYGLLTIELPYKEEYKLVRVAVK